MKIRKIKGEFEVRLDNDHLAGHIVWDALWKTWRFEPKSCRLSFPYIKDLYKFMRKLG